MGALHLDIPRQSLNSQGRVDDSVRLSARINADDEGLKSYRRASVTSFGME